MDLSSLILKVRGNLSDIPLSYISDDSVFNDIRRATKFVELIKSDFAAEDKVETGIEFLATYYTYVTWTVIAEVDRGEIPYSIIQRAKNLKSDARAYLQLISDYPIGEDLNIEPEKLAGHVFTFGLTSTIIGD